VKTIVLLLFFCACTDRQAPKTVPLIIEVLNDAEQPVTQASIALDGQVLGRTDDQGRLSAVLPGPEGRGVEVGVACPDGLVALEGDRRDLLVRFLRPIGLDDATLAPLLARFKCVKKTRSIVLLVRTVESANLPIRVLDRQIGVTDEDGVSQSVIEGIPGDEIEVVIDTSSDKQLRPQMPSRRLNLPKRSQILIFDQKFQRTDGASKKKKRRKRPGPLRL